MLYNCHPLVRRRVSGGPMIDRIEETVLSNRQVTAQTVPLSLSVSVSLSVSKPKVFFFKNPEALLAWSVNTGSDSSSTSVTSLKLIAGLN